jgi:type III secretion protein V
LFEDALGQVSRKICVHVHPKRASELAAAFAAEKSSAASSMADGLFYELGVVLGQCELVLDSTQQEDSIRLRINDLRSGPMPLIASSECAVNDTVDRLTLLNIKGQEAVNPADSSECAIVPKAYADTAERAGLTTWDTAGWAILGTSAEVRRSAAAMLNLDAVQSQLDKLGTAFPYLVSYVRRRIGEERFARVLRLLLAEGISIRNMRHIINGLALMSPRPNAPIDFSKFIVFGSTYSGFSVDAVPSSRTPLDAPAVEMSEQVRGGLKRYISHKYTRGGNTLVAYLVDAKIEGRLADRRPLSALERGRLLEAVRAEVGDLPPTARAPCVLTSIGIRRRLRSELEAGFPHLAVLSYQDLSPDVNIHPIARISAEDMSEPGR